MKRFLYLFQVPGDLPPELEQAAGPESEILFLSWRSKSSDPRSVYYPWSSWTQGRNRLLKEAIGSSYLYYVFGDGDVRLELSPADWRPAGPRGRSPWRVFEEFLLAREPAVGCPNYDWHLAGGALDERQDCQTLRFFDAVLNAFHREALLTLLPYYDLLDEQSDCYSQNLLCSLAADLYRGHVLQTNRLRVVNKEYGGSRELLLSRPEQLYLDSLRDRSQASPFLRQTIERWARHPTWGDPLTKSGTYEISEQELSRRYRLDHTLWTRRRELLARPKDSDFYSDDPETARARRWRSQKVALPRPAPPPPPPPPPPLPLSARFMFRTRALRRRLGLVRYSRLHAAALRTVSPLWRCASRVLWRKWAATPDLYFEIPENRQAETIEFLAVALDDLRIDQVVFVDVGAACGDALELLRRNAWLSKPVFSIGVDPVDTRGWWKYSGFVLAAVSNGIEGSADFHRHKSTDCSSLKRMHASRVTHDPAEIGSGKYFTTADIEHVEETLRVPTYKLSTILRQFGLADEVVHFLKIDAQGSDLDVFLSLGDLARNCLFLRIETVYTKAGDPDLTLYEGQTTFPEDRAAIEAAGFRLLNLGHFVVTPEADATFVNVKLFRELLPHLAS